MVNDMKKFSITLLLALCVAAGQAKIYKTIKMPAVLAFASSIRLW